MRTHVRLLAIISAFTVILCGNADANPASGQSHCKNVVSCNSLGSQALKRGKIDVAIQLFKREVGYAEDAHDRKQSALAYNNLAVAYLKSQDYLRALAWARLAAQIDPEDSATKHNLQEIQQHTRSQHWRAAVGGTYVQYAGRAQWNSLCASNDQDKMLHFRLLAYRIGAEWRRYGPAAYGDLKGDVTLETGGTAEYSGDADFPSCRIEMKFTRDGVDLRQQSDCGFGHGVRAFGHYQRISQEDDKGCDQDKR